MTAPLVSVIMPCYNMGPFVGEALRSVGAQSYPMWEVLAVEDASEDGTRDIVAAFAERFPERRVEYFRHPQNQGVSTARNTAIRNSVGKYVALLDPDDSWSPGHLESHVNALEGAPEFAVVTSPALRFSSDPNVPDLGLLYFDEWDLRIFPYSLALWNGIVASATVIRREALDQCGLFDETPSIQHVEDWDLWLRFTQQGRKFLFLKDATTRYRKHAQAATGDLARMFQRQQALAVKHMPYFFSLQSVALSQMLMRIKRQDDRVHQLGLRLEQEALRFPRRIIARLRRFKHDLLSRFG